MISRDYLECLTCGERTTTRTAVGHGDRQEFAFPCPKCSVELRFSFKLEQETGKADYDSIKGAKWIKGAIPPDPEPSHVRNLDGEHLVPLKLLRFSPYLHTFSLPKDPMLYQNEHKLRLLIATQAWPRLNHLVVHRQNNNDILFDQTARASGYPDNMNDWDDRLIAEIRLFQDHLRYFRPFTSPEEVLVRQRINLGESILGNNLSQLVQTLVAAHSNYKLNAEIERARNGFMRTFLAISGTYQSLYWDDAEHNLDDYQLSQKRFEELKSVYVDCFETLGRLSVIAATIEGVIQHGLPVVPKTRGHMTTDEFQLMANGSKPDILKQLPIADIFVSVMDSKLRNGVGHNSAGYDVVKDEIFYSNHPRSGVQNFQMSYIRFCETVVKIYRMFEVATLYSDWLRARAHGLTGRVV